MEVNGGNFLVCSADQISICRGFYDEIAQNMLLLGNNPPYRKMYLSDCEKKSCLSCYQQTLVVVEFPKVVFSVFHIAFSED